MHVEPVCVQMLVQASTGLNWYRYTGYLLFLFSTTTIKQVHMVGEKGKPKCEEVRVKGAILY